VEESETSTYAHSPSAVELSVRPDRPRCLRCKSSEVDLWAEVQGAREHAQDGKAPFLVRDPWHGDAQHHMTITEMSPSIRPCGRPVSGLIAPVRSSTRREREGQAKRVAETLPGR